MIVPSLVALIAENYRGRQQAKAIGGLGSARAVAGVLAFVIGGFLGKDRLATGVGMLILLRRIVVLSFRLSRRRPPGREDRHPGVVLAASAIILISFGFNNLNAGAGAGAAGAPFDMLGLSPAPIMIVIGIVLGQAFLRWTHRRRRLATPLLRWRSSTRREERAAVYALFLWSR